MAKDFIIDLDGDGLLDIVRVYNRKKGGKKTKVANVKFGTSKMKRKKKKREKGGKKKSAKKKKPKYVGLELSWKGVYMRIVGVEKETEKAILAKVNDQITAWHHGEQYRKRELKEIDRAIEYCKKRIKNAKNEREKQRWKASLKEWQLRKKALTNKNTTTRKVWIPKSVLEKKLKNQR